MAAASATVSAQQRKVIEDLFKAMQSGPAGEEAMMSLFADDAEFIEPFSAHGQTQTHKGKSAIRHSFKQMQQDPPPDMRLTLDRVDLDGGNVRAEWTCTSPVFPSPMKGYDLFSINPAGKIRRLEIVVTDAPPMGGE
jgi:hypothetical protein